VVVLEAVVVFHLSLECQMVVGCGRGGRTSRARNVPNAARQVNVLFWEAGFPLASKTSPVCKWMRI